MRKKLPSIHMFSKVYAVVFDLDDTLYDEVDYVKSGYKAVADFLGVKNAEIELWKHFVNGKPAIDEYLKQINRLDMKNECICIYREHIPNISLHFGVEDLIDELKSKDIKVGIITDGRPEGQKNKLIALGLYDKINEIIITDELGGIEFRKPCDKAFKLMQNKLQVPFETMLYVGDNMKKDFIAPQKLGMQWICVDNGNGLYKSDDNETNISISTLIDYLDI